MSKERAKGKTKEFDFLLEEVKRLGALEAIVENHTETFSSEISPITYCERYPLISLTTEMIIF